MTEETPLNLPGGDRNHNQRYITLILVRPSDSDLDEPVITWTPKRIQTLHHVTKVLDHPWSGTPDDYAWLGREVAKWIADLMDDGELDRYDEFPFIDITRVFR